MSRFNTLRRHAVPVLAAVVAAALLPSTAGAAVVFSDTFAGGSTLNLASTPTATSTSYDIASTKNQSPSPSIAAGHLKFGLAATTSGVDEAQALFSTSPVALSAAGDNTITYTLVFTNTAGLLGGGAASTLYLGLYNSGGVAPKTGLQSSGLNATASSPNATGGTSLWQGYNARIIGSTGNHQIYTRPQQNVALDLTGTSANQDLVGNGAGGGLYTNPVGTLVGSNQASTLSALTAAATYTATLSMTLNGDGSLGITSALYSGNGTDVANQLMTQTSATGTTPLATAFDGLVFGWRQSGTSVATGMDVNSITVATSVVVPVPEPTALGLAVPAVGLLARRRRA